MRRGFQKFFQPVPAVLGVAIKSCANGGVRQLFSTCTQALPTEPLLRALVVCSANPPDPRFAVECGEHGSCGDGNCHCEPGYSGAVCEIFDPCAGVDCNVHGQCVGETCQCDDGWENYNCDSHRQYMTTQCGAPQSGRWCNNHNANNIYFGSGRLCSKLPAIV